MCSITHNMEMAFGRRRSVITTASSTSFTATRISEFTGKGKDPAGPWSDPHLIKAAKGWIDPCPFWDDDGKAYLVSAFARSRSGIKSILVISRMSEDGTKTARRRRDGL